jgi:hypothetical protein
MGIYTIASALFILSFSFPVILPIGGRLLGLHHSSIHTALAMFLPLIALMPLIGGTIILQRQKRSLYLMILLLFSITICWFANFLWEIQHFQISEFDQKRIWFFIHGFLFPGLIGAIVSRRPIGFIQIFVPALVIMTAFSSLLYVMSYDFNLNFVRLLGEIGLGAAILASLGASACLSILILKQYGRKNSYKIISSSMLILIALHCFAIVLSGTRAAIVTFALSLILFFTISNRKKVIVFSLFIVIFLSFFLYESINLVVPEATINRLYTFYEYGIEIRIKLLKGITQIITENPLGKVTGYEDSILGMAYSHNAIVQLIAEAGMFSIPALAAICIIGLKNAFAFRRVLHIKAFIIISANVLIQSLSAGGAYNSLLWFLLFFFASLRGRKNVPYNCDFFRTEIGSK